jgi:hypothetical protein
MKNSNDVSNLTPVISGVPVNITVAGKRSVCALCSENSATVITGITPGIATSPTVTVNHCKIKFKYQE